MDTTDSSDASDVDEKPKAKVKKPSKESVSGSGSNPGGGSCQVINGEPTWELAPTRQVKIRNFKGKKYVDIREYYRDGGGDLKPGKKGICLSKEQFDLLMQVLPEVAERF